MKFFLPALVLFSLLLAPLRLRADAYQDSGRLTYTLEPVVQGGSLRLSVDLSFRGDATGKTRLHLPNRYAGQGGLYRNISLIEAVTPDVQLADTDAPDVKEVTFPPGQTVSLHYWLTADEAARAGRPGGYFRPALQPGWLSLIGATFWVYPAQYGPTLTATLHWKLPADWAWCDSLGASRRDPEFTGTLEQFLETVYVGGDFRIQTADVDGHAITVALRGKWKFSDSEFAATAAAILRAERDFWRDHDFPNYLVVLIPTAGADSGGSDEGGVELTQAVALFQPPDRPLDLGLKYVLAHEAFHTWNAGKIRTGGALYWFSEGFTDYYSRLMLLRAGLISTDEYAADFNRMLRGYWLSPARNRRGDDASRSFYDADDLARLPYQQGALLAANWNAELARITGGQKSLDDVMRDLRGAATGTGITGAQVAEAVRRYAPVDAEGDIQRDITEGATVTPDPLALGPGYTLRMMKLAPFDLGFDAEVTTRQRIVSGVKAGSHAFWAGLRDGQEVVSCEPFTVGDPNQRIELIVRDGADTRDIEFTPCGDGVPVPQYARNKAVDDTACRAWLGNPATLARR